MQASGHVDGEVFGERTTGVKEEVRGGAECRARARQEQDRIVRSQLWNEVHEHGERERTEQSDQRSERDEPSLAVAERGQIRAVEDPSAEDRDEQQREDEPRQTV